MSIFKAQGFMSILINRREEGIFEIALEAVAMWDWIVAYMDWDMHWINLLSSVCKHTYLEEGERWEQLSREIFVRVLHVIDLPVGASRVHIYDSREGSLPAGDGYPRFSLSIFVTKGSNSRIVHNVRKCAKLIVYMLRPGGGLTWQLLGRLMKSIESFLHPSNHGYWTHRLSDILCALCQVFYFRVMAERERELEPSKQMSKADITAFTEMMVPLALQVRWIKRLSHGLIY
jgi:hypothetical protein